MSKIKPTSRHQSAKKSEGQTPAKTGPGIIALEPRVLLDGAGLVTGAEGAIDAMSQTDAITAAESLFTPAPMTQSETSTLAYNGVIFDEADIIFSAQAAADSSENTIVFVDTGVEDYEDLVAGISSDFEIVLIDSTADGVSQIAGALEGRTDISAVHILSHGEAGTLNLGNTVLTAESVSGRYADDMAVIRAALSDDADILIYGCDFGQDASAVQALADATGADIAASDDLTGAAALGGDWDLEISEGVIETRSFAIAGFDGVLTETAPANSFATLLSGGSIIVDGVTVTATVNSGTVLSFGGDAQLAAGAQINPGFGTAAASVTLNFSEAITNFEMTFEAQQDEERITFSEAASSVTNRLNSTYGTVTPVQSLATLENGGTLLRSNLTDATNANSSEAFGSNSTVTWNFDAPVTSLTITHTPTDSPLTTQPIVDENTAFNGTILGGAFTLTSAANIDTDGDGVADIIDVDDDNDGILDTAEQRDPPILTRISSDIGAVNWPGDTDTTVTTDTSLIRRGTAFSRGGAGFVFADFTNPVAANELVVSVVDMDRHRNGSAYSVTLVVTGDATTQDFELENPVAGISYNSATGVVSIPTGLTTSSSSNISVTFVSNSNASVESARVSFAGGRSQDLVAVVISGAERFLDTDNDGIENRLDIDSDNDGITDNIEAQVTAGYIAPSGVGAAITDINQDGLDDNYDSRNASGTNTLTAGSAAATLGDGDGLTAVNSDGEDNVDYLDSDSDNEGGNDTAEAGLGTGPATGLSDADTDADGDGLFDQFETQNGTATDDGFNVNESIATGAAVLPDLDGDASGGVPLSADVDFRDVQDDTDTDGDGIADIDDVDDDNDGILDVIEQLGDNLILDGGFEQPNVIIQRNLNNGTVDPTTQFTTNAAFTNFQTTGTVDWTEGQYTTFSSAATAISAWDGVQVEESPAGGGLAIFSVNGESVSDDLGGQLIDGAEYQFTAFVGILPVYNASGPNGTPVLNLATPQFGVSGVGADSVTLGISDIYGTNIPSLSDFPTNADVHNATPNAPLSLDPNWQEVTFRFTYDAAAGGTPQVFFRNNGGGSVITLDGLQIQQINITRDTDGDGIANHLDIDSDNDGITDNIEGQTTGGYVAPSGTANGITDINADGLDDNYDTRGNTLTAGSAAASEDEGRGLTPVNTDAAASAGSDVTPDYLDADSDGDGLSDTVENGLGQAEIASGTLSDASNDADGDGLFDQYEAEIDGSDNDGFVVNEGTGDPLTAQADRNGYLPDAGDAMAGSIVPLSADLDYRDATLDAIPPAAQDDDFAIHENPEGLETGVIANGNLLADNGNGVDSDVNGDPLSVTQINGVDITNSEQITLASGALLTIRTDGTFDYDPNGAFDSLSTGETDTETFTYTLSDGTNTPADMATVTITINGDNDAPIIDLNGPDIAGTAYTDTFIEDEPGQPLTNLLSFDAIVQDDEDNITQVNIIPSLPTENDGADEFLRLNSAGTDLSIRLSDGEITGTGPLVFGDTTFLVTYDSGQIEITDADGGTLDSDDLEGFLRLLAYENVNQNNSAGTRTFSFQVLDPAGVTVAETMISVDRVNDAPVPAVLDSSNPSFDGTVVDLTTGETPEPFAIISPADESVELAVSDLLAQLSITDVEDTSFGIGIIFADESQGVWQYMRPDIADHEWTDFQLSDPGNTDPTPVPDGEALLMDTDAILRFIPNVGYGGGAQIQFLVWDGTAGMASNAPSTVTDDSGGAAPFDTSSLSSAAFAVMLAADTDGDGVINSDDIDDDNDGILDVVENPGSAPQTATLVFDSADLPDPAQTYSNIGGTSLEATLSHTSPSNVSSADFLGPDVWTLFAQGGIGTESEILLDFAANPVDAVSFSVIHINGDTITGGDEVEIFATTDQGTVLTNPTLTPQSATPSYTVSGNVISADGGLGSAADDNIDVGFDASVIPAGERIVSVTVLWRDVGGTAGTHGVGLRDLALVDNGAGAGSVVGTLDSDGDGIFDHLDIDSDNDGITDNIEAQTTAGYIAPSGTGAAMSDMDGDGLDDRYDATPAGTADGAGSLGLTPVNSDAGATTPDMTADYLDSDSDNDGLDDAAEAGHGEALIAAGTLSDATTDADGDGLFDVFETASDGNANDGYVVNEGISPLDGTLADGGGDASVGIATPLVNDLDYRDLNDAPIAQDDEDIVTSDNTLAGNVFFNNNNGLDTDPDGDTISVIVGGDITAVGSRITLASGALLTLNADGTYIYDPNGVFDSLLPGQSGTDTFDYVITDPSGESSAATVTLTILGVNDAPIAVDDTVTGDEQTVTALDLIAANPTDADSDPEGDTLTVTRVETGDNANALSGLADGSGVGTPVAGSDGGLFTVAPAGTATFDPNGDFDDLALGESRITEIVYQIDDGNGGTDTAVVTYTVIGVNDPMTPVIPGDPNVPADRTDFIPDQTGVDAVAATPLDLNTYFSDPDTNDTVTFSADPADLPSGLTLVNGVISGTPDNSASQGGTNGVYTIPVTVTDSNGDTFVTEVVYTITNPAPVAEDDAVTAGEDAPASGSVFADNGNGADADPDGDMITVSEVGGDAANVGAPVAGTGGGVFTINPDGSYSFDPNGDFEGLDAGETATSTVSYQISDGEGGTDEATVTVTVGGVNDAPEPQVPGSLNPPADDQDYIPAQSGNDSETLTPFDVSVWFNDPDGEVNFFSAPNLPSWMEINPFTGVITGTPPADASQGGPNSDGDYPITIIATDSDGESFSTVVTYTIANPAPTALDDMEVTDEDTVLSDNIFADNGAGADFDIDGDDLIVSEVNGTPITSGSVITLPSGALLTMNADGSYDYNPNRSFEGLAVGETGNDSFTYTIDDGEGGTAQATVNITVEGVNDAPIPVDPSRPTGPLDPSDPSDPSDPRVPPVNPQDYIPAQTGEDGVVQAPLDLTPYFGDPDNSDDLVLTVTPSDLPDGLVFDGTSITGTPTADASQGGTPSVLGGVYDIPVTATDPSRETFTTIVRYTITNPPPVAGDDMIGGDEDTVVTFNVFEANTATADIDPDGDVIVVSRVATGSDEAALAGLTDGSGVGSAVAGTDGGLFTVNADGTTAFDPSGDFEDLAAGETRTTQIVYQIDDGQGGTDTAVVTYTVTGVNDAPIPVDPTQPTGPLNPGDPVVPSDPRVPPVDPQDYIPAQTGDDAGPVTPLDLTPYFGDPDGTDVLTLSVDPADLPAGLTFDGTTISGTLSSDASQFGTGGGTDGVYEIPVTATDPSGAEFTTIVTYTISNPAPVAVNDVYSTLEDTALSVNLITGSDSDPDGDVLSIDAVALPDGTVIELGVPTQTEQGLLTVNTDGSVDFVPALNVTGQLVFGYTLTDGQGGTDVATVTIDVTPVNDAPIPVDPSRPVVPTDPTDPNFPDYPTDPEDPRNQPLDPDNYIPVQTGQDSDPVTPLDLTPYFGDPDPMEPLTITVDETALPPGVTFDPLTNTLSGTPSPDASQLGNDGTYEVEVTATDADGESVTTTLTYVITNPAPAAVTDGVLDVVEDTPTTLNVLGNDSDPDGDDLTVTQINGTPITVGTPIDLPSGASLTVNPNGSVTYTPVDDYNGPDSFTYTIDDGQGGTDTATVTLNVTAVNDAPVITPAAPGEPALPPRDNLDGDSVSVDASGPFSDIDGDDLTFSATGLPDGLLMDPVTGIISGTLPPGTSANGPFNVVITATDLSGLSASTDFVWTVENIPPATTGLPDVQTDDSTAVNISTAAGFDDLDGDALIYSAAGLPPGLSIDPDTGVISGTPDSSASVDGPYNVVVTVTDADGASAQSAFTLGVKNPAPIIAPMPPVTVVAGEPTVINVGANTADPDGDTDLTYSAPDLPPGLTLDPRTGIITGQPEVPQDTPYVFTVFVDDGEGGVTPVEISLQVNEDGYVAPPAGNSGPSAFAEPFEPLGRDFARLTTLDRLFGNDDDRALRETAAIDDRDFWGGIEAVDVPEYGEGAFISAEAIVYDHVVTVALRESISAVSGVNVVSWDVDYARSGGSLPAWIDHSGDMISLARTVADEQAVLHIRALLDNGRSVSMAVEVDMATGTVEPAGQSYARAATLSEQFEIAEANETAEHKALLMALAG